VAEELFASLAIGWYTDTDGKQALVLHVNQVGASAMAGKRIERQGASMNRSCITQRGLVLLLVVSTSCPALYAGFRPEQHVIVQSETNGPESVYAADLDGDGDLDVLSASSGDNKIAWYANDGTGRFGPQQVITTDAKRAGCIHAADLDGDGDLDVLSASFDKIAWYENDGSGHFGSQQAITTAAFGAQCVCAADLDGDGDLDVLSASGLDHKIAWYANDGTGQFGPQQVITTTADRLECVHAVDLDGDGDLDILSASYGGSWTGSGWTDSKIAWYANDGTGQFGPQQVITTAADGAYCVYAADLDGDGDLDVLSASSGYYPSYNSKIAWYANDGTGQFGPQQVITRAADGAMRVYAADLDGDGDLDVLSTSYIFWGKVGYQDSKIAWHANDGSGQFGPQQVITPAADGANCVYAADLDGDGDADVLSASSGDNKIAWYANDGSGQFGPQQVISTDAWRASCVYAADLDADGDLDVLSASYGVWTGDRWTDCEIAWYANDGTGHFGPQQVITTEANGATCVYAADLDGDGDLDVLSASEGDGKVAWYANDGTGQFGPQQVITTETGAPSCVYAADLDGDGDLDVLSDSYWGDGENSYAAIAWYANDGTGHFGPWQVIMTEDYFASVYADSVYAADLDGDGDLDVLSTFYRVWGGTDGPYSSSTIAWYANDGTGHFGPEQVITTATERVSCVYAADLDADGDLDVLSALTEVWVIGVGPTTSKIAWHANDGTGQFGPQQVITTAAEGPECVYAADLDGDGDLDVLSASSWDDKIAWYENE
jgi:hypothetical protein